MKEKLLLKLESIYKLPRLVHLALVAVVSFLFVGGFAAVLEVPCAYFQPLHVELALDILIYPTQHVFEQPVDVPRGVAELVVGAVVGDSVDQRAEAVNDVGAGVGLV